MTACSERVETWHYERDTMIKVKHRRYVQTSDRIELDVNCAAFRMEKDNFIGMANNN